MKNSVKKEKEKGYFPLPERVTRETHSQETHFSSTWLPIAISQCIWYRSMGEATVT